MLEKYALEFEESDEAQSYHDKIVALSNLVASKDIAAAAGWTAKGVVAISFEKHLYYPLLSKEKGSNIPLELRSMAFDAPSEIRFVRDLEDFCKTQKGEKILAGKSLYLLRNPSVQSKGLGFATAGNFYPDFLLWVVDDSTGQQWLRGDGIFKRFGDRFAGISGLVLEGWQVQQGIAEDRISEGLRDDL